MMDPVRGSAEFVVRVPETGAAPVRGLARLGSDSLLTALLALLGHVDRKDEADVWSGAESEPEDEEPSAAEVISRGLLAGHGRFTKLQVVEQAGMAIEDARPLWRALGFPEVDDEQRVFTSADVAALQDAASLLRASIVDIHGMVELARPLGHLLSRLAAAQTGFLSEVLGSASRRGSPLRTRDCPISWRCRQWRSPRSSSRCWSAPWCTCGAVI